MRAEFRRAFLEFYQCLRDRRFWGRHNVDIWWGLAWGALVPICSVFCGIREHRYDASFDGVRALLLSEPHQILFLAYPFVLAFVFGVMGGMRRVKDEALEQQIVELGDNLATQARVAERLRQIDHLKEEFLGKLSHEIMTPLTTVAGHADLLLSSREGELNEKQRRSVLAMRRCLGRLRNLLEDTLTAQRALAGQWHDGDPCDFVLPPMVEHVRDTFLPLFERKNIEFCLEIERGDLAVNANPHQTLEILTNIVSNAFKYTPEGGAVGLCARLEPSGRVRVTVRDTGPGIRAELLPHIFEPYRRDSAMARNCDGAGLGLAIVKELADTNDALLEVESQPGKGTRFHVLFRASSGDEEILDPFQVILDEAASTEDPSSRSIDAGFVSQTPEPTPE